jgi:ApbE superfamily uncharacterized protein (UPF0280 family)
MPISPFYRDWVDNELVRFSVRDKESDLFILADTDLKDKAAEFLRAYRADIEDHVKINPDFLYSLKPLKIGPDELKKLPDILRKMYLASARAGVGPMAGVAGAVAECVGVALKPYTENVIIENGGDLYLRSATDRVLGIFAGDSPLSGRIRIRVRGSDTPMGISTSSGTVGHSLSFGSADSVTILSKDATLADTAATAVCNAVKTEDDIQGALELSKSIEGVLGCVVIYGRKLGSIGKIEFV